MALFPPLYKIAELRKAGKPVLNIGQWLESADFNLRFLCKRRLDSWQLHRPVIFFMDFVKVQFFSDAYHPDSSRVSVESLSWKKEIKL
jgi:hypothetical protein